MINSFEGLEINSLILKALDDMGFEMPTEVQSKVIPHVLNREDLIVLSKTGSGKTAAFGIPILQLTDPKALKPLALILTPTRELAVQVDSDLKKLSKYHKHNTAVVFGQHSMNVEIQALEKGVSIVTGTPGRVYDHISRGNLETGNVNFLVLDEADRMLDMGFIDQVVRIIKTIPKDRVTLLFSATMPAEIKRICREYMKNPNSIETESETKTVDTIEQVYYRVDKNEKNTWLNRLLLIERPKGCLIFCNTRNAVDMVQSFLSRKGFAVQALHGDIAQSRRLKSIQNFKQGKFHILVATDVAARGIHIDELSLVINYDLPVEKDSYVHRIGRTGRAGNSGRALSLVTGEDIMSLYDIEEHIGVMIREAQLPTEDDYKESRDLIDKWVEENSIKDKPVVVPAKNVKDNSRNRPQTRPAQHHDKRKDRPAEEKNVRNAGSLHNNHHSRPAHSGSRHIPSTSANPSGTNRSPIIMKSIPVEAKKPLFKRILQFILGK